MGIGMFGGNSSCSCPVTKSLSNISNSKNFHIDSILVVGKFLIAQITYPDAKNYEGSKILVYEGLTEERFKKLHFIDPHFCEGDHPSPVARFEPTIKGIKYAIAFCNSCK